ncbi:ABC transporter permease [Mesobacillus zeae]|uniref:ABC transporter permease n=1 Tax=Mesobacillus zeae TaxID=1917180 RepID=A0A398BLU0_9BACI|nr:ABC transporter permease subunit [Mesobacillus zeae]RID88333.1 hypothetical protein D1970_02230 [Mesobacillus zeae]
MIGLIQNEMMKIFGKKASWIYMVAIVLAILIGGIIYVKFTEDSNPNWRSEMKAEVTQLEAQVKSSKDKGEKEFLQREIEQKQYYLKENIDPNSKTSWHFMNEVVMGVSSLVTLFVVIVGSANVSAEFSDGTIKQLLIRPHRRWSVLLSKYIAMVLYALMMVAVLVVSGYLISIILCGNSDFNMKMYEMTLDGQKIAEAGPQFFMKILYLLPSLFVIMTIAFMLSTLFKSQALAVGIGIFVLFFSSTVGGLIVMLADKYTWAKFLIFPHLDLKIFAFQDKIMGNITLPMSLGILGVYYLIFIVVTFVFFQKRDISI